MRNRREHGSLRTDVVIQAIVSSVVPIVLSGGVLLLAFQYYGDVIDESFTETETVLVEDIAGANLQAQASLAAHQIDTFLIERIAKAEGWAAARIVVNAAREAHARHGAEGLVGLPIDRIEKRFVTRKSLGAAPEADMYLRQQIAASPNFAEMFFTDRNGFNVAVTNPTSDFVQSDELWWQGAWSHQLSVREVGYDESAGVWSVDIAARINDPATGEPLGVLKTVLAIDAVQKIADRTAETSAGSRVYVATREGILIADTASGHAREIIMNPDASLTKGEDASTGAAFDGGRPGHSSDARWVTGYAHTGERKLYVAATRSFTGLDWIVILQSPVSRIHSLVNSLGVMRSALDDWRHLLLYSLGAMAIFSVLLAVAFANFGARRLLSSIGAIRDMAERAMEGEDVPRVMTDQPEELVRLHESVHRLCRICTVVVKKGGRRHGEPHTHVHRVHGVE